jgi:uncharacterized membrane protein YbaN (DUF454 family)
MEYLGFTRYTVFLSITTVPRKRRIPLNLKKTLWFSLGVILLGIAYIGVVTPGIPWSTPAVGAAYCFARSSERMHRWIYNHRLFGPFLRGWAEKRIFPQKLKYFMLVTMASTLLITWLSTGNIRAVIYSGIFLALVAVWAWRYPSTAEEYDRRVAAGKPVAWLR